MMHFVIFFPSQSPFIDFKDKDAGSALKIDEKLSAAEMDILPILPVNSNTFNIILFYMIEKELLYEPKHPSSSCAKASMYSK